MIYEILKEYSKDFYFYKRGIVLLGYLIDKMIVGCLKKSVTLINVLV